MKRLTKKQRDRQEREYATDMDEIDHMVAREEIKEDVLNRTLIAQSIRTHNGMFQDSYGAPVVHVSDEEYFPQD